MDLFFLPDLIQTDTRVVFSKEESKHIARVMRKSVGDQLQVTNGKGLEITVELFNPSFIPHYPTNCILLLPLLKTSTV